MSSAVEVRCFGREQAERCSGGRATLFEEHAVRNVISRTSRNRGWQLEHHRGEGRRDNEERRERWRWWKSMDETGGWPALAGQTVEVGGWVKISLKFANFAIEFPPESPAENEGELPGCEWSLYRAWCTARWRASVSIAYDAPNRRFPRRETHPSDLPRRQQYAFAGILSRRTEKIQRKNRRQLKPSERQGSLPQTNAFSTD